MRRGAEAVQAGRPERVFEPSRWAYQAVAIGAA